MTCSGIEVDEDFSPFNLPPIPIQNSKEIWNANQKVNWNGRVVQMLNPVKRTLQTVSDFLSRLIQEKPYSLFEACIIETVDALEEEGSDWCFAPAQELLSTQITEDMTLEQFLEQTGMTFDRELGHVINCKSWLEKKLHSAEKHLRRAAHSTEKCIRKTAKKVEKKAREIAHSTEKNIRKVTHSVEKNVRHAAHSVEKNIREAAKETEKFVRHHKKEVIIAVVAVAVVIAVLQIPGVAQAVQTAVVAALMKLLGDALNSPSRKEEGLAALNSLPEQSASPPQGYNPQTDHFMRQVFGDLLPSKPTPSPNHGIYTLDAEQKHAREAAQRPVYPPSFKAPRPSYTPPSPNSNFVQQFYDNLFKADPQLNPHKHIGKMQPSERTIPTTPPAEEPLSVPKPTPTPSAPSPFKSDFGTYLENLHRGQIASANASSSPIQNHSALPNNPSPSVSESAEPAKGGFTRFLEIVRQGLETIGRMSGPEVDSLDVFNEQQVADQNPSVTTSSTPPTENPLPEKPVSSAGAAQHFFDLLFNNFQAAGQGIETPEVDKTMAPGSVAEQQNSSSFFKTIAETLREHLERPRSDNPGQEQNPISSPQSVENSTYKLLEAWVSVNESERTFNPLNELLIPSKDPKSSCHFQTEGKKLPGIGIGFINGMNTTLEDALHHANHIRKFAGDIDISIDGVYNHSNGAVVDSLEIITLNYEGHAPNSANLLVENWTKFFEENPDGEYLQFAHSQGSIILAAALSMVPQDIQSKITVVTVGTAKVIPKYLDCESYPYRSESDWIHRGEDLYVLMQILSSQDEEYRNAILMDFEEAKKRLIVLKRHPDAKGIDHDCESPTNDDIFRWH